MPRPQQPKSPPVRVEIRVAGRVRFLNEVYDPRISMANGSVHFIAEMNPTMVNTTAPPVGNTVQAFEEDPRNTDEVIMQVHSGRRAPAKQVAAPSPKPAAKRASTRRKT